MDTLPITRRPLQNVQIAVAVVAGVAVFLLVLGFGNSLSGSTLDSSWQEVLNWAIAHHAQWGKDIVFTYGPLGFLIPDAPFDPGLYWLWLGLQFVIAGACALLVAMNLSRLPVTAGIAFLIVTAVIGYAWASSARWFLPYPLTMMVIARIACSKRSGWRNDATIALLAAFGSALPLIKFSAFPLWLPWLPCGFLLLWLGRQRRLAAVFLACGVITPLMIWLLCGQALSNLPVYLRSSWQISIYYGAAQQAAPPDPTTDAIDIVGAVFGAACFAATAWQRRRDAGVVVASLVGALTIALAYRAGTLRADGGHLMIFWSTCIWLCVFAAGMLLRGTVSSGLRHALCALVIALTPLALMWLANAYPAYTYEHLYNGSVAAGIVEQNADNLMHIRAGYAQRMQDAVKRNRQLALPLIVKIVNGGTVDLLMHEQGWLLANGMNYRPRPVFQSYSAYSDYLARLNADFFLSPSAPQWAILDFQAIDGRYPTVDDSRALIRILQNYQPVLSEKQFILFQRERMVDAPLSDPQTVKAVRIGMGGEVGIPALPSNGVFARLDVHLTRSGRLAALLAREPVLHIEVFFKNGHNHQYRIPRALARSGFLLSPVFTGSEDYLGWLQGNEDNTVVGIRVLPDTFLGHPVFRIKWPLRLYPVDLPRSWPHSRALFTAFYPGFDTIPDSITQQPRRFQVSGHDVLNFEAPAGLLFKLAPGTYAVSADYGILPNVLTDAACRQAHADGIGFGIAVGSDGHASQPSAIDYMDPFTNPSHRYAAHLSRTIRMEGGQVMRLLFTPGPPGSNAACDWAWIRNVHIRKLDANVAH